MNKCLLLGLVFALHFSVWTQKPMWKHFGIAEGLYEPTINAFAQDNDGILWLGGQTGLIRFDGKNFLKIKSTGEHPYINTLVTGKDGIVWVGSRDGIWKFDPKKQVFRKIKNPVQQLHVNKLCWNKDSTQLLVAAGGVWTVDKTEMFTKVNIDIRETDNLFNIVPFGNGFITSTHYKIFQFDLLGKTKVLFESQKVINYDIDQAKKSLLIVSEDGVCNLDIATKKTTKINFSATWKRVSVETYNAVHIDPKHKIWITVFDTLYQFDSRNDQNPVKYFWLKENQFSLGKINCLFTDRDGNTWANSEGKGIAMLSSKTNKIRFNTFEEMDSRQIWSTMYDLRQNKFYYGTETGIQILDLNKKSLQRKTIPNPQLTTKFTVTNIQDFDEKHLVISTYGSGAWLLDKTNHQYTRINGLVPVKINAVYCQGKSVFAFTDQGIQFRKSPEVDFVLYQGTEHTFLGSSQTANGDLYACNNSNLYHIQKRSSNFTKIVDFSTCKEINSAVLCNMAMENGDVFLGTINNGLFMFNHLSKKIEKIILDPIAASVYGMATVSPNQLLFTTNNGIYLYNLDTRKSKCYNINNLLPFNDFNQFGCSSNNQMISLTGSGGMISASPKDFRNLFHDHASIIAHNQFEAIQKLIVPAGEQSFSVNVGIGLKYIEHKPDFVYRLKGLDQKWHVLDPSGNISYNYVPPGNYILEIKMHDPNHILGDQTKNIPVQIIPLWWQTFWFQLVIWILSLVLMISLIRYYSRLRLKWKIRKMEAEQRINNERMRISRELHDNVGSQLSYLITGLEASEMMLQKENTESLTRNLGNLQDSARESMQQLRDAIWALNKEEILISLLIERFSQWTHKMSEQHDIRIKITSSIDVETELDSLKTLNIFRILQESVHNILKHAKANEANIHFSLKAGTLLVSVQDNGCGFENIASAGNGLKNMQTRAKELGAELEIDSQKNIGTALLLKIHINTPKG